MTAKTATDKNKPTTTPPADQTPAEQQAAGAGAPQSSSQAYVADAKKKRDAEAALANVQVTDASIQRQFNSMPPDPEQAAHMDRINKAARAFAQIIKDNTRNSADQTVAIRLVRQATWTANSCVMLQGR